MVVHTMYNESWNAYSGKKNKSKSLGIREKYFVNLAAITDNSTSACPYHYGCQVEIGSV